MRELKQLKTCDVLPQMPNMANRPSQLLSCLKYKTIIYPQPCAKYSVNDRGKREW